MVRRWLAVGFIALFSFSNALGAAAGDYESGFGFAITVPDIFLVLTRAEVQENSDLFLDPGADDAFGQIPGGMRREVFERVAAGQIEIFYRTEGINASFVDNVNVMSQRADLPRNQNQLNEVCRMLPGEFSRMFGRPVGLDGCEMRRIAGRPALYLAFDGAIPGTKTLQYQVQQASGDTIVLTATAENANLTRMMGEFEEMVASIRLN